MTEPLTIEIAKPKIINALKALYEKDRHLFDIDASERCIMHKFASYFTKEFPDYNVDCEYNRDGREESKVIYALKTKGINWFTPDCIVHKRGEPENKLIIECKCSTNVAKNGWDRDHEKLKEATKPEGFFRSGNSCQYDLGLFIEFTTGKGIKDRYQAFGTWFVNGRATQSEKELIYSSLVKEYPNSPFC